MLIKREESCLLVVDMQEKLIPAMSDPRRIIVNCEKLMKAAQRLDVPMVVSEQYPKGIGPTMIDLRPYLPQDGIVEKNHFPMTSSEEALRRIRASGKRQMILSGVEAHVCVMQTALALKGMGFEPFVVADAVASRKVESEILAFDRLRQAGIFVVNVEMVLFEWLGEAGTPEFKDLMPLIK